ncbi:CRISPR-associated helicase Cas3 [Verrucomicrobia bacterium]|nr:CRISPR-associated helicase Cas3 [Verrucomicrobiota bacterium]
MRFREFFKTATGGREPYDYQCRLAEGGCRCESRLINIPTGLGKTAAAVLAWLWNRIALGRADWPRRLVYCLPMRTLVEQTRDNVREWLEKLAAAYPDKGELGDLSQHSPIVLMGGEDADHEWDVWPEKPAILIGTQDMLLSRALNRGYGMSRYRWPMHFGLLNNDCLWVMDETQLMGVGVETSAQLDGFRHDGKMPTFGACPTWWMSATLDEARLATVDHPRPVGGWRTEKLSDTEQTSGQPHKLITAQKKLAPAPVALNSATKGGYAKQLASLIKDCHQPGTFTLVVVNRVSRAREVFETLTGGKKPLYALKEVALVHSRFRPIDRGRHMRLLFGDGDRIVIATQAVEAGIDVSARLLVTELAPWSSLVQRMGRCNRRADSRDARVLWVDIEPDPKGELLLPYSKDELDQARTAIAPLTNASPRALCEIKVEPKPLIRPVIRRRDLVDLFDTTSDICGQDVDVSRYIRDGDDNDVQFFWRNVEGEAPTDKEPPPQRDELCRVSIGDAVKFLGKKPRAWRWNPLSECWDEAKTARPGAVYLVEVKSGGYSDATGWTGEPKDQPTPPPPQDGELPRYAGDRLAFVRQWQPLAAHTAQIVSETDRLTNALSLDSSIAVALRTAALWHDTGKAHDEFQAMLVGDDTSRHGSLWAKSANKNGKCRRPGFRHELASALAWLLNTPADAAERDLIAYLIAAHHGKVRLSIRSLPEEQGNPTDSEALFARGICHGDKLPPIPGIIAGPTTLDLSFMQMGEGQHGPSWLARTVALRDRLCPFRLAFLETLLRAADARASRETTT